MENSKICSLPKCQNIAHSQYTNLSSLQLLCQFHTKTYLYQNPSQIDSVQILFTPLSPNEMQKLLQIQKKTHKKQQKSIRLLLEKYTQSHSRILSELQNLNRKLAFEIENKIKETYKVKKNIQKYKSEKGVWRGQENQTEFLKLITQFDTKLNQTPSQSPNFLFYFVNGTNIFCSLDLSIWQTQYKQIPQLEGKFYVQSICRVGSDQILFTGSLSENQNQQRPFNPFILNTESSLIQEIFRLPQTLTQFGIVKYKQSVFLFGGRKKYFNIIPSQSKLSFVLQKGKWRKIRNLPQNPGYTSCLVVENKILIVGDKMDSVISFSPQKNKFEIIFRGLPSYAKKYLLLTSKGEVLCMVEGDLMYVGSGLDLKEWRSKGITMGSVIGVSERVERENSIFYINVKGDLVKIDIETYEQGIKKLNN